MNAADLYRKAFACLPDGDFYDLADRVDGDDPEIAHTLEQGIESLALFDQAVQCTECDWGPEAVLGIPDDASISVGRLAMLACLRAEESIRRGDDRAGLDDLLAIMTLGWHLACGIYIPHMVGLPIANIGVTKATEVVERLDSATRRAFADKLDALPPFPSLSLAVRAEQTYYRENYRDKFATFADGSIDEELRLMYPTPVPPDDLDDALVAIFDAMIHESEARFEQILSATGGTRMGSLTLADETLAAFDTLIEIADESETPAGAIKLARLREQAESNPLLAQELVSFDGMLPFWTGSRQAYEHLRSLAVEEGTEGQ